MNAPKAEPINTEWIPIKKKTRAPKVLKWFDNPYFVQKEANFPTEEPNFNEVIKDTKTRLHDKKPEKKIKLKGEKICILRSLKSIRRTGYFEF